MQWPPPKDTLLGKRPISSQNVQDLHRVPKMPGVPLETGVPKLPKLPDFEVPQSPEVPKLPDFEVPQSPEVPRVPELPE